MVERKAAKQTEREQLPDTSAHWRHRLHTIIFESDTPAGKTFDVVLLIMIALSTFVVLLESIPALHSRYFPIFMGIEWFFTILFTIEYILRLISVRSPRHYALSFYGMVDLLAILPSYFSLLIPGWQYFLVIRVLRLLRIFRIFKLAEYLRDAQVITRALYNSRRKISVFLLTILLLVTIIGSMMYVIEGEASGFTDIPTSIYWAIVTLTTVGYGDLAPRTAMGKVLASMVMLLGYAIIAVPTGIVTAELTRGLRGPISTQVCPYCSREGHDADATFCKFCGSPLNETPAEAKRRHEADGGTRRAAP